MPYLDILTVVQKTVLLSNCHFPFQALSFKGWVDLRDVIIAKAGATAAIFIHMYVFMGSMIGELKNLFLPIDFF